MQNLRRQSIDHRQAFKFHLAADARNSRTNYVDDQAWTVKLGRRDEAALAFQTQYGGRADLVSLAPIWLIDGRSRYQCFDYARPPKITHFAPNFVQIDAAPIAELAVTARFWAMESRAAGGQFTLTNTADSELAVELHLFGHVVIDGRSRKLNVLTLADFTLALHLGQIGDINPVATLEGASPDIYGGRINSPKLGRRVRLAAGASASVAFVVAGLADMRDAFSVAMNWMSRPWTPYFERFDRDAAAVPRISTGDASWDRVIDLSYVHLLQTLLGANEHLPNASQVASRAGNRGWSRRGDGSDHMRPWAGQDPTLAYLSLPALATIDGGLAQGVIENYLATQDVSGFIDRQPGLAGQRQGLLMMPLLARLCWLVYQSTEDREVLAEALPRLLAYFQCWLSEDNDADEDGVPEWRSERQTGYIAFPTFGRGQYWAQGADIRLMETPDLLAYLITEADALCAIAETLGDAEAQRVIADQMDYLQERLDEFWDGSRYAYRDRDTHLTGDGVELLRGGAGDLEHLIERDLPQPARVMVRIVGGVSQRPRIKLSAKGTDEDGRACALDVDVEDFAWLNRQGVYISEQVFRRVDRIAVSGLSRVYKVYATTLDSSRLDINALLPLWTGGLAPERARALIDLALDEAHFWRPNGLTMVSASDRNFDPSNARGGGGIWMYWLSLIGEGMVKAGHQREAAALVKRVLAGLSRVLEREGYLSQFYHAEEAKGFGEDHHAGGIAPLHLLNEVMGIRILSPTRVVIAREFGWGEAITVEQHGVTVTRGTEGATVDFPSGQRQTLPADAPSQVVVDPVPREDEAETDPLPAAPESDYEARAQDERRVVIDVEGGVDAGRDQETGQGAAKAAVAAEDDEAE